ncbi:MAG: MCE family protein, partial [Crocinitomicaceae bacterium]|nr:MCE family protein [Crocinitomicaceae bacterium]
KEIKVGVIALLAIAVLVAGINFLKGNSFFGGDDSYYAYFPNSGQLMVSSNVTLNGVVVGKVTEIKYMPKNDSTKNVRITFNIQNKDVKIPKGSIIEIGSLDLFNKGVLIQLSSDISKGFYKPGSTLPGRLSVDMMSQVKSYADPISQRLQAMMTSVDKMVVSLSSFWDETATSEIEGSLRQVKITIEKLGNVATEIESFVGTEKIQFSRIMSNIENITGNLKKSNDEVTAIIGNTRKVSDDLVSADFKNVILDAQTTIKKLNAVLADVESGNGTIGKLLHDEKLYTELVETNNELQNLVNDLQLHPERYVHFSVLGAKTKGVPLTGNEEKKLRKILDSIPE